MKNNLLFICSIFIGATLFAQEKEKVTSVLDAWHQAASDANFDAYFDKMTDEGVFIGTDATENWQNNAFKAFSKPYFDTQVAHGVLQP